MSPRPDVSEERKTQNLNTAEQVFIKKGLDEARMDDIAEETGLSKGTLTLYFKSQDQLIFSILERVFQGLFKQQDICPECQSSAKEAIHMNMPIPLIRRRINAGGLKPMNEQDIANAMSSINEGTVFLWVYDSILVDLEKHIRSSMDLLQTGILT